MAKENSKNSIKWLKNIGSDGWSATMESESAYENEGGYISESGNWKIYREGQWYERDWGSNFERRGLWGVYHNDEYYGNFKTLNEAKIYVENWVEVNPQDFKNGGMAKKKDDNWMQGAEKEMEKKGTVGLFTKKAENHDMTTVEFANKVLGNPDDFDLKTRREAQFMKNANPELFKNGGKTMAGRKILYEDENVKLEHNMVSDHYSIRDSKTNQFMEQGGDVGGWETNPNGTHYNLKDGGKTIGWFSGELSFLNW